MLAAALSSARWLSYTVTLPPFLSLSPPRILHLSSPSTRATRLKRPAAPSPSLVILPPSSIYLQHLHCCRSFAAQLPAVLLSSSLIVAVKLFIQQLYRPRRRRPTRATALRRRSCHCRRNRRTHQAPPSGDPPASAADIRDTVPIVCLLVLLLVLLSARLHPALSYAPAATTATAATCSSLTVGRHASLNFPPSRPFLTWGLIQRAHRKLMPIMLFSLSP